jgi:hypothetical protein
MGQCKWVDPNASKELVQVEIGCLWHMHAGAIVAVRDSGARHHILMAIVSRYPFSGVKILLLVIVISGRQFFAG